MFSGDEIEEQERLFLALVRAEDRVSRLDERARGLEFLEGWRARADLRAVLAAMYVDGQLLHPEDLILHDLGADVRPPDQNISRARALLRARQKAWRAGEELLSWRGVVWLQGRVETPPPPGRRSSLFVGDVIRSTMGVNDRLSKAFDGLAKGVSDNARAGVEDCLSVLDITPEVPPLCAAAALLEAWRLVEPGQGLRPIGAILGSVYVKTAGRFTSGLLPIEVGVRRRRMSPRLAWAPLAERLAYWLDAITLSADLELEEIVRLKAKKVLMERRANGARRNSHGPALLALALQHPALTTPLIASALGVTPQAALQLVKGFGGTLQEITGRKRYRVWRL